MSERFLNSFHPFVLPFMIGMFFMFAYCIIGAIRVIGQLPSGEKKKFFLSLVNPKTLWKDIKDLFCDCIFHVKLWKRNKLLGYMQTSITFGWLMLIVIGHIEVFYYMPQRIRYSYFPIFFRFFTAETGEADAIGKTFYFLMDFFLLMVLSGIVLAIIKRISSAIFGMRRTTNQSFIDLIGLYSLWAIFPLRLLAEGFTADVSGGSFLTKPLNYLFASFLGDHANMLVTWWGYSLALGIFFAVMPFTRYMHIPAEILMILMKNAGVELHHPRKGYAAVQVNTCSSCGVCIDACPMGIMRTHLKDTTVYLNRQIRRKNNARIEKISEKCLLCGKCSAVCQVQVQGDLLRVAQRTRTKYSIEPDYSNIDITALMAGNGLSVTVPDSLAQEVAPEAGVQRKEKVLYFAGCMTSLTPKISKATASVLKAAGVDFEFMDKEGGICCGRPMWMAGRIDAAKQMMEKNKEIIRASGATTLLVNCPICYRIFKEKYALEGVEVIHHTQFFERLISEGKLSPKKSVTRYVYHDPCELGRGCGVYEEPRKVVSALGELVEAGSNHKESVCCGGSLGSLTLDYGQREPMVENSLRNLTVGAPDEIVTACPLCLSTFGHYANIQVRDIAEVLDNNLKGSYVKERASGESGGKKKRKKRKEKQTA